MNRRRLETFDAPDSRGRQIYTFQTDELTSHCPFDFGGPDHYTLTIQYEPDGVAVESRSLKEYIQAFRDREVTAESLGAEIYSEISESVDPKRLYVRLEQSRRGGIEETVEVGDRELSK